MHTPWNRDNFWRFAMGYENDETCSAVEDYDMAGFDSSRLGYGRKMDEPIDLDDLRDVKLWVTRGDPFDDYFANPVSWHIVSDRFVGMLQEMKVEDRYQLLPAPLFDSKTKAPIGGYHIFNPLNLIGCLDKTRSKATYDDRVGYWCSTQIFLHYASIPADAKVFRIREFPAVVIFRGSVAAEYYRREYTGAWFRHAPTEGEQYIETEGDN